MLQFERGMKVRAASLLFGWPEVREPGWLARVEVDGGNVLHLSRLDTETEWHVDARFNAGSSMPVFMNGDFSRCTIPHVARGTLKEMLDLHAVTP